MVDILRIQNQCGRCAGTGIDDNKKDEQGNPVPESCTSCGGDGWMEAGKLDVTVIMDDLQTCKRRLKKIMDKFDIGE